MRPAKKLVAALHAVDSANQAEDVPALTAALQKAGPALATAAR